MTGFGRYFRLFSAFARFGLASEMSFRANFLVKLAVEALWLGILILFYDLIFQRTQNVAGWDRAQYLFFLGCHYALAGLIETFFLENCTGFAELVRTGDLDLYLLKPIDEQFLITCRKMDWSTFPNILQGAGVMAYSLWVMEWTL
ncbi:MAG: ABC-2 family transporter protein, partial [Gemmataceae bacterium]